jgi:hypothetical protein
MLGIVTLWLHQNKMKNFKYENLTDQNGNSLEIEIPEEKYNYFLINYKNIRTLGIEEAKRLKIMFLAH